MRLPRQPIGRGGRAFFRIASGISVLFLAGCANGDFGEVKPSLVSGKIHNWVPFDEATGGLKTPPSQFQLTDDERQLRDLAYPLIEPPYDRKRWYSIAGEYGWLEDRRAETYDPTAYANYLFGDKYRSPAGRYAQLIDDIRNDTTRLGQFFETAARVSDIDRKREKSFAFIPTAPAERADALRRISENTRVIRMVQNSLDRRVESYRFAMERLIIATPQPQAVEVERVLNQLRAGLAHYRDGAPPKRSQSVAIAR